MLAGKLAAIDVSENERNFNNKINRCGFTAAFFVQCLAAMEATIVQLWEHLATSQQ
jgi:cobalamin biosynthesis Co2+ chelatase CbiK